MKVLVILSVLVAVVLAEPPYPKKNYPAYSKPSYSKPSYDSYDYAPIPYNFAYAVKDDYTYNDFGHQESSDGYGKTGSYYVQLPDGRLQTVNYKADEYGYVADVSYKGEAKYPDYQPSYKPAYKPAYPEYPSYPKPSYKPSYPKY